MPPPGLPRPEEVWRGPVVDSPDDSMPIVERHPAFRGRIWSVVRDRVKIGDHESIRDVQEHPGAVAVIALDDEDNVLLIRQYRHPVAMYLFEPPAGLLDVDGEPPWQTARRELAEEGGIHAEQWDVLVDVFNSPGGSSEAIRVYLARDLTALPTGRSHTGEAEEAHLPQVWLPLEDVVTLILDGSIGSPPAVAGVLALAALRARGMQGLRPVDAPWQARAWLESAGRIGVVDRDTGESP